MRYLPQILTFVGNAILISITYQYVRLGLPNRTLWHIALFVSGVFAGTATGWLMLGLPGFQGFLAGLLFGLPLGFISVKQLPIKAKNYMEEAERNRRARHRDDV